MERVPMTPQGKIALEDELRVLKTIERPEIIQAIAEARAHGDLSENAEYHAAKEKQGFIEARIRDIEGKISCAEVIDPAKIRSTRVCFGATVTVVDEETDEEVTYQIVGFDEADLKTQRISNTSPLARALIGKSQGESVEVRSPRGVKGYEILKIAYT
ncbi:MAG: transcription elongation factor GreA [Alphaproteobacteria bacterium]|nr:MAG: transcription elongation factor GreA [Alphaproteobacteria bacterium]